MKFMGYRREDGSVGIRNHVLIMATVGCAAEVVKRASEGLNGVVSFVGQNGCGENGENLRRTNEILTGLAANPNIYGVILVGLGCEVNNIDDFMVFLRKKTSKPVSVVMIQEEGGNPYAIAKVTRLAQQMVIEASKCKRVPCDMSELILGVECGGSDATSGLVANPVLGEISDRLIALGGTSMFSETIEMVGAEYVLAERAKDKATGEKIIQYVHAREKEQIEAGGDIRKSQPSPGNQDGGITTLEEKSLGCIHKGGHTPIMDMVPYAQKPNCKGLVLMDTPTFDLISTTAKAAAGCQLIVFTTGRGSTIANPVAPVLKVTANHETFIHMEDNIDLDLSGPIELGYTMTQQTEITWDDIVSVLEGQLTKSEVQKIGFCDVAISRACDYA